MHEHDNDTKGKPTTLPTSAGGRWQRFKDSYMGRHITNGPDSAEQSKLGMDFIRRWYTLIKPFYTSRDSRVTAWGFTALVVVFLVAITMLNGQLNNAVRGLYNALGSKNQGLMDSMLWYAAGLFAVALPVRIVQDFCNETFALRWRIWMTRSFIGRWLSNWAFFHLNESKKIDNPDERIQVDIDHVTGGTIMFITAVALAVSNMLYFIPMLWSYSPWLVVGGISYAVVGTIITRYLGLILVGLNFVQRFVEGNFRTALVAIKQNSISIALFQGEKQEAARLAAKFDDVVNNSQSIILRNTVLTGITKSYDYVNMLLPFAILGALVTSGVLDAGAVPSASQAFGLVMGSLSILISQFKTLADLAADVNRLYDFSTELARFENADGTPNVNVVDQPRLAFNGVTVTIPGDGRTLIRDFNLVVEKGTRVLIVGRRGCGKSSTIKSLFGLWPTNVGTIERPPLEKMSFVPQDNYLFEGTLRANLLYPGGECDVGDQHLLELLEELKLTDIIEHDGEIDLSVLDQVSKWKDRLSGGQQQSVGFARMFLRDTEVVVLDEATSSLDVASQAHMYNLLKQKGKTVLSIGHSLTLIDHHDLVAWVDGQTQTVRVMTAAQYKAELSLSPDLDFELKHGEQAG